MGESLEGARIALRCDNPLVQLKAATNDVGIAELACFLGDSSPDLVRMWPQEAPESDCVADRVSRYAPIGSDQGGFGRDYRSVPPPTKDVGTGLPW